MPQKKIELQQNIHRNRLAYLSINLVSCVGKLRGFSINFESKVQFNPNNNSNWSVEKLKQKQ